jgi:NADH dehydrogenase
MSTVSAIRADRVELVTGEFIPAELVVWAAGIKGPDVLRGLDGPEVNGTNQLVTETTLVTTRDANIFAIGDCAACPRTGFSGSVPPRAQAAHQEAAHLVKECQRRLQQKPLEPFVYLARSYRSVALEPSGLS